MYVDCIRWLTAFLFAVIGWVTMQSIPASNETKAGYSTTAAEVIRVIDGDTIEVRIKNTSEITRVRYIGIDTPESYAHPVPDCGSHEATLRNKELVAGKIVTLIPGVDAYDTYGRLLAYVYVDTIFVNQRLLEEGWARVLMVRPNTDQSAYFKILQDAAQESGVGIWGICPNLSR
jgi:micrococcal nuclease